MKANRDILICVIIYLITFGGMLWYNLSHVLVNDGVYEYRAYLMNIEQGWIFRHTLVNSCLITTWIPAMIQKLTGWDSMILFRVFPPIFYALMPAFTYLIAKRYLGVKYSIVAVLIVILSSYILYFPDMGRVGVAIGLMAGLIWTLLEKRLIWSIVFAVLLVFAHYGTSLIAIGIVGAGFILPLMFKKRLLKQYLVVLCILLIITGVWHFGIAGYSGDVMSQTLFQTEQTGQILPQTPDLLDITTREPAVQAAIGMNLSSVPQVIEVIANWLIAGLVSIGLFFAIRNKKIDSQFKIMAVAFWGLILFTIAMPTLSVYYGGMRVYFTSLMLLAVCFPLASEKIANIIHLPPLLFVSMVLILYGLSTSGIIYLLFGLVKTFPVAVNLP